MRVKLKSHDRSRRNTLNNLKRLAWLLDNSITLPIIGYRIGFDAVLGLIPVLGDVAGLLLTTFIIVQAIRLGAPRATLMRMVSNAVFETLLGSLPVVGDVFDATYKANTRNVRLLLQAVA